MKVIKYVVNRRKPEDVTDKKGLEKATHHTSKKGPLLPKFSWMKTY